MNILLNSKHDLRSGWKLGAYFATFILIWVATGIALSFLYARTNLPDDQLTLLALNEIALIIPAVVTVLLMARFVDHRPLRAYGIRLDRAGFHVLAGLGLAAVMLAGLVAGCYAIGFVHIAWTGGQAPLSTLALTLGILLLAGAVEEMMFRGFTLQILSEGIGNWPAIIVLSTAFGLVHINNPNASALGTVNTIVAGILLSLAYIKTRSLWLPYAIHIGWNVGVGFILGLPLSGLDLPSLWTTGIAGSDSILGGGYGPEGGLLATFIFATVTLLVNRRNWNSDTPPSTFASRSGAAHQPE